MGTYPTLTVEHSHANRIATVTMNRPEVHNALNPQLLSDIKTAFDELSQDDNLSGVILTGAGKSFSAGADLLMMQAAAQATQEQNQEEALQLASTFEFINSFPIPVLARVNGAAMGGGLGLLAVSDIVIAVDSARLAFSEVKLGIAPAVISPYVVRKIGPSWARRLFVTGERFTPALGREIGLLHMVVTPSELDVAVENIVQELLSSGPYALRACKALARDIGDLDAATARAVTTETIALLRVSAEGQEGIKAYLEKRKPQWSI
ncbi:MAG TPA: enoyl-CoA hydratase-related protein [Ktedonobacteraceae bacterium]